MQNSMKNIQRLEQMNMYVSAIGFSIALFILGQTQGLGIQNDISQSYDPTVIFSTLGSPTIFESFASAYSLISVSFLFIIGLGRLRPNIAITILRMLPIIFIFIQFRLLFLLKIDVFRVTWPYANWLRETYYCDFLILALAISLLLTNLGRLVLGSAPPQISHE